MGVALTPIQPLAGGVLEKESIRWQIMIPPLSSPGGLLILRRHRFDTLKIDNFQISPQHQDWIQTAILKGEPLIICGSTGVGKTSLLTALLKQTGKLERTFVVDQIAEFPLIGPLWKRIEVKKDSYEDAFRALIRLNPDRVVFGELPAQKVDLIHRASQLGLNGISGTMHASNLINLKQRISSYAKNPQTNTKITGVHMIRSSIPKVSTVDKFYI